MGLQRGQWLIEEHLLLFWRTRALLPAPTAGGSPHIQDLTSFSDLHEHPPDMAVTQTHRQTHTQLKKQCKVSF